MQTSLTQMAVNVLNTKDGREKTALSRRYAKDWFAARTSGAVIAVGKATPRNNPGAPTNPISSARAMSQNVNRARWRARLLCCMRWHISNSMLSICTGTLFRGIVTSTCPWSFMMIGYKLQMTKQNTSN